MSTASFTYPLNQPMLKSNVERSRQAQEYSHAIQNLHVFHCPPQRLNEWVSSMCSSLVAHHIVARRVQIPYASCTAVSSK